MLQSEYINIIAINYIIIHSLAQHSVTQKKWYTGVKGRKVVVYW